MLVLQGEGYVQSVHFEKGAIKKASGCVYLRQSKTYIIFTQTRCFDEK